MLRFGKPNGESFDLDYEGPIHAFDGGNDLIAICEGAQVISVELCDCDNEDLEIIGDPRCWDDWEIVINCQDESVETMLMQALATAYSALALAERMVLSVCPEDDD